MRYLLCLVILLSLPTVSALVLPCPINATVKGLGEPKIFNLTWPASNESDVRYEVYYNFNSTPIYLGNQSWLGVVIVEGVNHFGLTAKTDFEVSVCEANILYNRNRLPYPVAMVCPNSSDVESSTVSCLINYTYLDPDNDTVIYAYFVDGNVSVADISAQNLPTNGISTGLHNLSICGFDGLEMSCSHQMVNFYVVLAPKISSVRLNEVLVPFYGNSAEVSSYVNFTVNDSLPCTGSGYLKGPGGGIFNLSCSGVNNVFICVVNVTYSMEPGDYDMYLRADNGYKSVTVEYRGAAEVYDLISAEVVSPIFDMTQVFDGWVISQTPVKISNMGNLRLNRLLIESEIISCTRASFDKLLYGRSSDVDDAIDISSWFGERITLVASETLERNIFVGNEGRANPGGCSSIWGMELLYDR